VVSRKHAEHDWPSEIHYGTANFGTVLQLQLPQRFRRTIETWKVAKDYQAVGKSFKRNGSVWEVVSNKAYAPAEAQKLGCDLENMTDKKITITESNTDFVNAVLKVPTEADINPDDY